MKKISSENRWDFLVCMKNPILRRIFLLFAAYYAVNSTSKWAKIAKCSPDTALRDIQDLINKQILRKEGGGGRSTGYEINK